MQELNELLALIFVAITCVATIAAYRHPANTPRTRAWWGRFLRLLGLLIIAQIATNIEQFYPTDGPGDALNALEHLSLIGAGVWGLTMTLRGLSESYAQTGSHQLRHQEGEEVADS